MTNTKSLEVTNAYSQCGRHSGQALLIRSRRKAVAAVAPTERLSQEKLADLAGISLTTVARLERQSPAPCRSWTLARLAIALGEQQDTLARQHKAQPQEATASSIQG